MLKGNIIPGRHFRGELEKEGLDLQDAVRVLKMGNIFHEPEPDTKTGDWKYRVEGTEVDGKWLAIVFCFKTEDTAFLIPCFLLRQGENDHEESCSVQQLRIGSQDRARRLPV